MARPQRPSRFFFFNRRQLLAGYGSLMLLLLSTLTMIRTVGATVTILSTGARYGSRQDKAVGKQLWRGYEYMAALQFVPGNLPLCPPPPSPMNPNGTTTNDGIKYPNVTVPDDGLPVALVVKSGTGCTLEEKIEVALTRLQPAGIVRYLLVDSSDGIGDNNNKNVAAAAAAAVGGGMDDLKAEKDKHAGSAAAARISQRTLVEVHTITQQRLQQQQPQQGGSSPLPAIRKRGGGGGLIAVTSGVNAIGDDIPLYIIYVSPRTQLELLDYLLKLDPDTLRSGGPRISIDSRDSDGWWDGEGAVYIALSALLSACACSFLLFVGGNYCFLWSADDELNAAAAQQHPARPQRRRLTRDQVKRMLPQWYFDGDSEPLRPVARVVPAMAGGADRDESAAAGHLLSGEDGEGTDNNNNAPVHQTPPQPVELSLCSICLDDYEPGDKLRVLQCNHAFHGKCIGKWLVERSATCPLCKTELWDDEEEAEEGQDDQADAVPAATAGAPPNPREYGANGWDRAWHRFFTTDVYHYLQQQQQQPQPPEAQELLQQGQVQQPGATDNSSPFVPLLGMTFRQFWRGLQYGRRSAEASGRFDADDSASAMLSEPLLPLHANESELRTLSTRSPAPSLPSHLSAHAAATASTVSNRSVEERRRSSGHRRRSERRRIHGGEEEEEEHSLSSSAVPPPTSSWSDPLAPSPAESTSLQAEDTGPSEVIAATGATPTPPGSRQVSV